MTRSPVSDPPGSESSTPSLWVDLSVGSDVGVRESTQAPAFKAGLVASYRGGELQDCHKLYLTQYLEYNDSLEHRPRPSPRPSPDPTPYPYLDPDPDPAPDPKLNPYPDLSLTLIETLAPALVVPPALTLNLTLTLHPTLAYSRISTCPLP